MTTLPPLTPRHTRSPLSYDTLPPLRSSFLIQKRSYNRQFANVYFLRLAKLKPKVLAAAKKRWGTQVGWDKVRRARGWGEEEQGKKPEAVERVLDVLPGKVCWIVGTVYCEMKMKPNVLEDLAREHYLAPPPVLDKWVNPNGSDSIMLEDESGRIKLVGLRKEWTFVTGIIVGVLGIEIAGGDFQVIEVCYPGLPPQPPLVHLSQPSKGKRKADAETDSPPPAPPSDPADEPWVALTSGLELLGSTGRADVKAQFLAEYLSGELGRGPERNVTGRIARLIIAGNGFATPEREADGKKPKRYGYDPSLYSSKPGEQLDAFLSEVLPTLDVDLLPGDSDPTGITLPQQPLHHALLPRASRYEGFTMGPNPWWAEIGGATFLGTSGQNLDDVYRYVESTDRLGMAMTMLKWSHIAPTAPDTLWSYPFHDNDPFILPRTPHVFFIGNQPEFATGTCKGPNGIKTRVILIPKFSETGTIVILNPRTLECKQIKVCQTRMPRIHKVVEAEVERTIIDMDEGDDD